MEGRPTIGRCIVRLLDREESALGTPDEPLWAEVISIGKPFDHEPEFKVGDTVRLENLNGAKEETDEGIFLVTPIINVILVKADK